MVSKVTQLLHEYQNLFSTNLSEIKGILGDIGVIKIPLKPDANPVKQCPYRMNPKYKEKVRMKLDKMLATGLIEVVEDILTHVEARNSIETGARKCQRSLLWRSQSY